MNRSTRAVWRDGRGALRMRRPGMAVSGLGDILGASEAQLISELNRFTGSSVPQTQKVSPTPFSTSGGITEDVATQVLIVSLRRLQGAVGDAGSAKMAEDIKGLFTANQLGGSTTIKYVQENLAELTAVLRAFGNSLGLPPAMGAGFPVKTLAIVGGVGLVAFFFLRRR